MKRFVTLGIMICVGMSLLTGVFAQAGKFSVQFDDTPLSRALDAFKRFDPNFQFALAPELGDTKVTVSLDGVTVDEALTIVLGQAGLMSVKDAGVYQIRQKPDAKGPRVERPALRLALPVFINRSATPGEAGGAAAGAAPAAGAAGAAATAEKPPLRLIIIRFADPGDMALLFGGSVEYGGSSAGGSGGGGGGGGGYGSSNGSSGGYGSSNGSSGGYGSSNGSSGNSGSSRGSSSSRGGSY